MTRSRRIARPQAGRQFEPAHALRASRCRSTTNGSNPGVLPRFAAPPGRRQPPNLVASLLQHGASQQADGRFVFDQQDAFPCRRVRSALGGFFDCAIRRWPLPAREKNLERRAFADFALEPSAHPRCCLTMPKTVARPEARAFALVFRGEERLENARQVFRRNAATGVGDAQADIASR